MSWEPELDELRRRTEMAHAMGGPEKVARQHEFGKLTVRERVERIVDAGSFDEIGTVAGVGQYDEAGELIGFPPSNFVFGVAEIDGRPVIVSGDDFTVRGGSADASIGAKRNHAEGLALELRLPHVRLVDGMGGGGSVKTIEQIGRTPISQMRGWDVVLAHLVGGSVGVARARLGRRHRRCPRRDEPLLGDREGHRADDDRRSRPRRLRDAGTAPRQERAGRQPRARHERRDRRRGRSRRTKRSRMARRFLSYLPTSVDELPRACRLRRRSRAQGRDAALDRAPQPPARLQDAVDHRRDRRPRRRRHVVVLRDRAAVGQVDHRRPGSLRRLARSRSSPRTRTSTAARGRRRRRRRSRASSTSRRTFHLPLVHLVDCPGFLIGLQSEQEGTIRYGSRALAALGESPSPYCSVVIRKAFGVAGAANWRPGTFHYRYAWPSGDWGSLPVEGRHRGGLQGRARGGRRTAMRTSRRSGLASIECAHRSEAPRRSTSRTSSIHATPVRSCAGGPTSWRACDDRDRGQCASAPDPRVLGRVSRHFWRVLHPRSDGPVRERSQRSRASSSRSTPQSTSPS